SASGDLAGIGKKLSADLGKTAAAVPLGDGWKLQGAGICMVGQTKSAQVLFSNGKTNISLMSVPIASYAPPDYTRYDEHDSSHLLSGISYKQVVYCLIASSSDGSVSAADLTALREKLASILLPPTDSCSDQVNKPGS